MEKVNNGESPWLFEIRSCLGFNKLKKALWELQE